MRKPYQVRESTLSRHASGKCGSSVCTHCGRDATKEVLFKGNGITIIEKDYDDCLKSDKFTAIMTFYGKDLDRSSHSLA